MIEGIVIKLKGKNRYRVYRKGDPMKELPSMAGVKDYMASVGSPYIVLRTELKESDDSRSMDAALKMVSKLSHEEREAMLDKLTSRRK